MMKRVLSLLLCALMVVSLLPIGLQTAKAESTIVYSMASDIDIQCRNIDDTFEGTTWLQRAGSPMLTIVDNSGIKAISVTGRTSDWYCIDLKNLTTLPDGFDYSIKVTGRTAADAKMKLSQPASPYGTHISQVVGVDGAFSLEKTFTYAQLQAEKSIRIQSEGTTGDFTVDSIVINQTPASGGETPPPDPPSDGAIIDDITITFDDADKAMWSEAFGVSVTTNAAFEWVSDFGNSDTYALKGFHLPASADYTGANNAIRLTFDEPLAKNAVYTISYSVYVPAVGNEGKDTLVGPGIVLSGDYAGATGVTKFPSDPGTIATETWKEVNVTTPAVGLNETLKSIDFRFVVNDASKHPDVWYIDNIEITQTLIDVGNTEPDYKDYPALKDVYKDYFLIGTASANSRMTGDKLDIIKYHFNAFTPENEMKPSNVQNVKGVFTYSALDEQLGKLEGTGINLIGHTLTWHSQSPGWMWGTPNPLPANEAKANMDAHIESVLGRYGADLYCIDVVNEAIADGKNNADWRQNLRDNEGWYLALGSEWVEYTFLKAAEIVDANGWDCKLYYNDFNLDYTDKATSVYNMVKDINQRYAGRRPNGKPLIEGIGMQGHYNQNTDAANVERSINLFSTLPGVSISVTELDITYTNSGSLTEEQAMRQAVKYAQLFDLYKKNAAGPANNGNGRVERVTLWGTNDADSWRSASFPLLFDRNLRAKEAFKAVLDPAKYLSENEPPQEIPKAKTVYGTPTLGTNDAAWQKAVVINVNKNPTSQEVNAGASAVVKTLWDASYFYVRAEVTDAMLDKTSTNAWEQDSVEIFFSETAHRNASYADGDGQYRVNFEGSTSFKSDGMADGFNSWAASTDTGYIVEMKIPFRVIEPEGGMAVSFDVQINDVSAGASTRLITVWSDLKADGYNTTERWGTLTLARPVEGVHVYATNNGDSWSGANIILGNDAGKWPWSTAGTDGKVAFTPEKDTMYRIAVNYTAMGTNAIRVRWLKDESNGGYTTQDGQVIGASPSLDPTQVAASIPVYFNKGMATGGTYTLTTEIKLDGSQPTDGLIGNIAIRGGGGGNAFSINWLTIEKVEAGGNSMLVRWPAPDLTGYTATANGAANTNTSDLITLVFEKPVPGLTATDIAITDGTASVTKGTLTAVEGSSDTQYTLAISGVTIEGTVNLKITKDGVDDKLKVVDIHRNSITFNVANIGGTAFVRDSTGIRLTFNAAIPGLSVDDILLSPGTPAAVSNYAASTAEKGALTKVSDTVYELALTGITRTGTLGVQVNKLGIETNKMNVLVNAKVDKTALQPTPPRGYFSQNITNLPKSTGLNDLFKFLDSTAGTNGRVETVTDWKERRDELKDLIQYYYYGRKYPTPKNAITVNAPTNQVNVTIADNSNTVTASLGTVTVPPGTAPEGGWPVIIAFGFGQTAMANQNGYAVINVSNWGGSRTGNYYKLYPFNPYEYDFNTGSIMTAAWTVSRIIDAMEISAEANGGRNQWNINPYKSITTGVSINGKYALMAAAMDDRVGAAAPVDCGQSGASSFRYVAEGKLFYYNSPIDRVYRRNQKGLNSIQYSGESFWMGLGTAAAFHLQTDMDYLPFDSHAVEALMAPRPLIAFTADNNFDWTTPPSSVMAMSAAKEVYEFLDSDNIAVRVRDGAHAIQNRDVPFMIAIMDKEFSGKPLEVRNLYPDSDPPSYGTGTYNKITDMTVYPYDIDSSYIRWSRPGKYTLWTENEIVTEGIPATIKVHSDAPQVRLTILDADNKPTEAVWTADVVNGTAVLNLTAKQVKIGRYEITTIGSAKDSKTVYFQGVDAATALRHGTARNDNGAAVMYGFTSKINKDLVEVYADGNRLTQSFQEDTEQSWILNYGVTTNPNENNRIPNNAFSVISLKKLQMEAMPGYTFEISIDKAKLANNQETVSWNASAAVQKIGPQPSWPPYPNSLTDNGTRPLRPATTTNFSADVEFSWNDLVELVPGDKLKITFSEPMYKGDFGVGFDFSDDFTLSWAEDSKSVEVTFNNVIKGKGEFCNIYVMRLRDIAGNMIAAPIHHSFTRMPDPEFLITVTGVRPGYELGLAFSGSDWVSAPRTTIGDTVLFAVPDKDQTYRLSLCQISPWNGGNAFEPIVFDVQSGSTVDISKYFYDVTIPEGYSNVGITCMDQRWCVYQANAGDTITLLKTGQEATIVSTYKNREYTAKIMLDGSDPFTSIVSTTPTASVMKLNGYENELTITVTDVYAVGLAKTYTETFTINNNAAGTYNIGPYRVYVDTKGNIQIRQCYIVK